MDPDQPWPSPGRESADDKEDDKPKMGEQNNIGEKSVDHEVGVSTEGSELYDRGRNARKLVQVAAGAAGGFGWMVDDEVIP